MLGLFSFTNRNLNLDKRETKYIFKHREYHQDLVEELRQLESRTWDYTDEADRKRKEKRREELRLDVLVHKASANPEQIAAWNKIQEERMDRNPLPSA
jgi:hypothetical protein